ncbi:MAG: filament integrity protein FraC [Nodosilinea sp.]
MPIADLLTDLGLMPLRAVVFQTMLLMVAIALEAMVLRQHLRLGYQTSVHYAASLNLLATSLGWLAFLAMEAILPSGLQQQVISYVLFNHLYVNELSPNLPMMVVMTAMGVFFLTYWVKLQGLNALTRLLGVLPAVEPQAKTQRRFYPRPQPQKPEGGLEKSSHALAVLHANAFSFTAILLLLMLRLALQVAP